jgi:hypothetical protein
MAYAAGLAFVRLRRESTDDETCTDQYGTRISHYPSGDTSYFLAPVLQIEAAVRLTRRLAVVPYFRASAFDVSDPYRDLIGRGV